MNLKSTEGVILRSIPFKDYDQILTLYSRDWGLLSVIVKAARSQRRHLSSATAPLSRVELFFKQGKQDLHTCREISALNHHLFLRESAAKLRAACELAQSIRTSQVPEKPSPELYFLLQKMIERLQHSSSPISLVTAFRLKILNHDGLLHWTSTCSSCQKELHDHFFFKGEPFCPSHSPAGGIRFQEAEFHQLKQLIESRQFQEIERISVSDELAYNAKSLFEIIYL